MMLFCKLCGAMLVLTGCMGVAAGLIHETKCHISALNTIRCMMMLLQSEVSYKNLSLVEAFLEISDRLPEAFKHFMKAMHEEWNKRDGTELAVIWREQAYRCLQNVRMKKHELDVFASFGEQLGFQDRNMQLTQLQMYENSLKEEAEHMTQKARETGRIYRLLGIMGGIFIIIILI